MEGTNGKNEMNKIKRKWLSKWKEMNAKRTWMEHERKWMPKMEGDEEQNYRKQMEIKRKWMQNHRTWMETERRLMGNEWTWMQHKRKWMQNWKERNGRFSLSRPFHKTVQNVADRVYLEASIAGRVDIQCRLNILHSYLYLMYLETSILHMHSIQYNIYLEASVAGCVYRYMTRVPHARHVFCIEHIQKTCLKTNMFHILFVWYSICWWEVLFSYI